MTELGIPFLLLASVWGAFEVVLKAITMLNNQRDLVLNISADGARLDVNQKKIILSNDFLPLYIGTSFFLIIFTVVIFVIPRFVENIALIAQFLCYIVGVFVLFCALAMFIAGYSDIKEMKKYLDDKV